ncbi:hypothetical protein TFKS16_0404 [Tannerella forsythia KS16]|nr:hypothetical protein TFKS16_0404 [Tannerella forsythia KS16]
MIFRTIKKTKIQKPRKKNGRHRVEKKRPISLCSGHAKFCRSRAGFCTISHNIIASF